MAKGIIYGNEGEVLISVKGIGRSASMILQKHEMVVYGDLQVEIINRRNHVCEKRWDNSKGTWSSITVSLDGELKYSHRPKKRKNQEKGNEMKSVLVEKPVYKKQSYPVLAKCVEHDIVVLFTSPNKGTIVHIGDEANEDHGYRLGDHGTSWPDVHSATWKKLPEGSTVTLTN